MVSKIVGNFLYYALAVDSTMLVALSNLSAAQSKATEQTYNDVMWLLNYTARHSTDVFRYKQSDMILQVHNYVSYLSVTKACSRVVGYHYLNDNSEDPQ